MQTTSSKYELLYECYRTGQMDAKRLHEHFAEDEVFKRWYENRTARRAA